MRWPGSVDAGGRARTAVGRGGRSPGRIAALQPLGNDRHMLAAQVVTSIRTMNCSIPKRNAARADRCHRNRRRSRRRQQRLLDHLLARVAEDFRRLRRCNGLGLRLRQRPADRRPLPLPAGSGRPVARARAAPFCSTRPARRRYGTRQRRGTGAPHGTAAGIADFTRRNLACRATTTTTRSMPYPTARRVPLPCTACGDRTRSCCRRARATRPTKPHARPWSSRSSGPSCPRLSAGLVTGTGAVLQYRRNTGEVVARRIHYFERRRQMEAAIDELITYLAGHYGGEGMYLVEHLLLRPIADTDRKFASAPTPAARTAPTSTPIRTASTSCCRPTRAASRTRASGASPSR